MKTGKQKVIGDINITPLTDVFLVLLIIMMVVNPLLQTTGVSTTVSGEGDATETPAKSEGEEQTAITVSIDAQGAYSMGSDVLDDASIKERIRTEAAALEAAGKEKNIILEVDPASNVDRMTTIMDYSRSVGIEAIALERTGAPPEAPK